MLEKYPAAPASADDNPVPLYCAKADATYDGNSRKSNRVYRCLIMQSLQHSCPRAGGHSRADASGRWCGRSYTGLRKDMCKRVTHTRLSPHVTTIRPFLISTPLPAPRGGFEHRQLLVVVQVAGCHYDIHLLHLQPACSPVLLDIPCDRISPRRLSSRSALRLRFPGASVFPSRTNQYAVEVIGLER